MNPVDVSGTVAEVTSREYNGKTYRSLLVCTGKDFRGGDHMVVFEGFGEVGERMTSLHRGDKVNIATVIESRAGRNPGQYFTKAVARKVAVTEAAPVASTTTPSAKADTDSVPF
jgi:hypothetical protein